MTNRAEIVKQRVAEATPMYRGVLAKAYGKKASPRTAIKAMCLSCMGYERVSITGCTGYSCPLWAYRPYQDGEIDAEPSE